MSTPAQPPRPPQDPHIGEQARLQAWHELHRQLQELHAKLQYAKLLLRLGVGSH